MPEADLALLETAARAAGEIALRHFGTDHEVREKPGGLGPVTAADLEVDRMLRAELLGARPGYGWLSEESADGPERLAARRAFIVDPIDGTRAYVAREKAWAHSLALTEGGRVIAAVVHLPALRRTYTAREGGGAYRDGARIGVSARAVERGSSPAPPSSIPGTGAAARRRSSGTCGPRSPTASASPPRGASTPC